MQTNIIIIFTFVIMSSCQQGQPNTIEAPIADKVDTVLSTHGHNRIDPYFWMRLTDQQKSAPQPDIQTEKVLDYLKQENDYLDATLGHTEQLQEKLYQEMIGRIKQNDETVPYFDNGYWYYTRYREGQEYPIYCRKKETLESNEEIILNVNDLSESYSYYSAVGLTVSPDNKILAFGEDTLSRRIYTVRFKNLETGEFLEDRIENTNPGGAWANDNQTYFYTTKNRVTLLSEKIFRHRLGQSSALDEMVYQEQDPAYYIGVRKSKSGDYIIIWNTSTLISDYYILKADDPNGEFKQFTPRNGAHEYSLNHRGDKFFMVTNWKAKNFRLMETRSDATSIENWREVIPHRDSVYLEGLEIFKDYLVLNERKDGLTKLRILHQVNGDDHYLEFEEPVYTANISINRIMETDKLRFSYTSLTTPNSTYEYDMSNRIRTLLKRDEIVGGHDPRQYQSERIWATARDGIEIPISMVYRKGFKKNGQGPLLQYAYGSYGSTVDPYFVPSRLSLLDRGFAIAICHIRGGSMLGREWYEAGKMFSKKNTFNDFIDCSKFLIEQNYTSADHLYAQGGSAGGLLMGAIVNMNPELYHGVIAAVPFVDVVSTMLDASIPLTSNEWDEWGDPRNKDSYEYMLSYSPYDNVVEKEYPNMLVTAGLYDSQVQYWEPAKWVAKLRSKKTDNNLLLLKTDMSTGHSGASGRFKRYKITALQYAMLLHLEGITE